MAPPRRLRLLVIAALAFTVTMLIYTSRLRDSGHTPDQRTLQDFYHKTKGALGGSSGAAANSPGGNTVPAKPVDLDNDGDVDEDDLRLAREMQNRLKAAEQQAKDQANAKSPNRPDAPSDVIGVGSAAGAGVAAVGAAGAPPAVAAEPVSDENKAVDAELDAIVKKSPVVIFSKTYCPFSKKAKGVLLDKYVIDPAPYVVELDTHPLGPTLQARLAELTGRRTVPNILIGGKSIGGGDDIAELDGNKALVDRIVTLSSKRVTMKERLA